MAFSRILVPLDGSPVAKSVLPSIIDLAKNLGATVHLHAVVDPATGQLPSYFVADAGRGVQLPSEFPIDWTEIAESTTQTQERLEEAERFLDEVRRGLEDTGVTVESSTSAGDPPLKITEAAVSSGADLIAMACNGWTGLASGLVGSVAERLLFTSTVPILIFKPSANGGSDNGLSTISTIIVGLDGSELAEQAISHAAFLSKSLKAGITLTSATAAATRFDDETIVEQLNEAPRRYLLNVAAPLQKDGLDVSTHVSGGTAARELLDLASKSNQPLLIVTTRGRSGFTRWSLGSVTDRVVRSASCPVLAIPSDKEAT